MKKSKKQTIKTIVFMVFFSAVLISLYFFIRTRTIPFKTESTSSISETDELLTKDIPASYPSSPDEVLVLYGTMTKCLFNEELTPEQIEKMANQLRELFDDELLENNPYTNYLLDLNTEVDNYRKAKRSILEYNIENSDPVKYWDSSDKKYASAVVSFTIKEGNASSKVYENFILRQDEESKWKILGWKIADKEDTETEK